VKYYVKSYQKINWSDTSLKSTEMRTKQGRGWIRELRSDLLIRSVNIDLARYALIEEKMRFAKQE